MTLEESIPCQNTQIRPQLTPWTLKQKQITSPMDKNAVLSVGCFARLNLTDNIGNIGFLTNPIFWIVVAVWETEWRGCDCWLCQNSFFKVCFAPFSQKIKWIFICPACDMFPTRKWLTTRVSQYHCYAVSRYGPIPCFEASYAIHLKKSKYSDFLSLL